MNEIFLLFHCQILISVSKILFQILMIVCRIVFVIIKVLYLAIFDSFINISKNK
jgi:hypothetical protein